ncbi:MAG: hypothetical protein ACTSQO_05470 [Candidatus Helarchaeota archaeon]
MYCIISNCNSIGPVRNARSNEVSWISPELRISKERRTNPKDLKSKIFI